MVKCPNCKQDINYLLAVETRDTELKATYDVESEELNLEPTEEWHGNPLGEQTNIIFSCPKCKANLFGSEEQARKFLSRSSNQEEPEKEEGVSK